MSYWSSKNLGNEMWAWEPLEEIRRTFLVAYEKAARPQGMALFTRHESEGRLHCELVVYFSPAAMNVARGVDAELSPKPLRDGLSLLAGSDDAWTVLFQG